MPDIVLSGMFRPRGGAYRRLVNQAHIWTRDGWPAELVTFRDGVLIPMQGPEAVAEGLDRVLRGEGHLYREDAVRRFRTETAVVAYLDLIDLERRQTGQVA